MSKPKAFIGIDPGMGGALAILRTGLSVVVGREQFSSLTVEDMPVHEINGKRRIDLYGLGNLLRDWSNGVIETSVVIENVGAMPGQSPNSMFSFGFACGAVQSACATLKLPMVLVVPQVWKKMYGIPGGKENKDMSRRKASMIFPNYSGCWARKKDDGRAEAVLLAHYGSRLK